MNDLSSIPPKSVTNPISKVTSSSLPPHADNASTSVNDNINTNNYFSYGKRDDDSPLIEEASLLLDGKYRFDHLPEFYYRTIFPDSVHSVIPMKYVYTMPFSIRPEDNQPTGSLNMSRFNDITLALKLCQNNPQMKLFVFAVSYNILTIENGSVVLEFVL